MAGDEVVINAFGALWALDLADLDAPTRAMVAELWSRAATDRHDDVVRFVVTPHHERRSGQPSLLVPEERAALPYALSRAITLASIARRAGHSLMFHAAGLSSPDGVAAALVAPSGAGKTTAALTLGRHLGYLSDETVAVNADHSVDAYAKPLSVLDDPRRPFDKTEHSPDSLGLLFAPDSLRLGVVLLLDRDETVRTPRLEHVPLVEAILEVIPQTSSLPLLDRPLQVLARTLTLGGGPWRLTYAEIADCVDLVRDLVAASAQTPSTTGWTGVDPPRHSPVWPPAPGPADAGTRVVRAPWRDAVRADGETVVLRDDVPLHLAGIGQAIWDLAEAPVRVSDLVPDVVRAHGGHPDAARLVLEAAAVMVDGGALLAVDDDL